MEALSDFDPKLKLVTRDDNDDAWLVIGLAERRLGRLRVVPVGGSSYYTAHVSADGKELWGHTEKVVCIIDSIIDTSGIGECHCG